MEGLKVSQLRSTVECRKIKFVFFFNFKLVFYILNLNEIYFDLYVTKHLFNHMNYVFNSSNNI